MILAVAIMASTDAKAFDVECSEFRPLMQDRQLKRPEKPFCASSYLPFTDSLDFDTCRREVQQFKASVEKYLACVESESKQAVAEYNDVVASFNRRAQQ
ncbi:hypothetical protein ACIQUB_13935 [Rhizobium sp. NPDC090275]|uniref:hypothetical protein n=1 Tax=Rhizobium sp. NPDC090275 TaxID=3364498 RepID=UPI0013AE8BB1